MKKNIPRYITDKRKLPLLLTFMFVFSVLFLLIYTPFDGTTWYKKAPKGSLRYFFYILLPIVCGIVVLAVSRYVMFWYNTKKRINYWRFGVWVAIEIIVMALVYSGINKWFLYDTRPFLELMKRASIYIGLILLIPYSLAILYMALEEKNGIIRNLKARHIRKNRAHADHNLIHFNDNKGVRRLSVRLENLIYLEGADNYINVYYLNKGKVVKFMYRNSLKNVEDTFKKSMLIRCHRSYIVNVDKVAVLRREKEGLFVEIDLPDVPNIPVSQTYSENILNLFSNATQDKE
ncbi:MAG: LytTR family transcriptional regulator DNA-binding domain-containing protein [Bacteroidales bacterium]|jgi:hypothetical protein|nr:LytTR family transcriptional regulator DNA-binding domain-containing protein [Bacteroidales bacterium]